MKHMKKLASLLLALVMLFAIAIPAFAAPDEGDEQETPKGSITISNSISGESYSIYKLLDLELTKGETEDTYSYKPADGWENFFSQTTIPGGFLELKDGYVIPTKEPTAKDLNAFTEAVLEYAEKQEISATETAKLEDGAQKVTFEQLALGYYLVQAGDDTVCSLTTTDPDATIYDKTEVPSIEKQVSEGDQRWIQDPDSTKYPYWIKSNDVAIGDRVDFKTTITAPAGASDYVLIDTMDSGLQFDAESLKIGVELAPRVESTTEKSADGRYMVISEQILKDFTGLNKDNQYYTLEAADGGHGFKVTFTDDFMDIIAQFYKLKSEEKTNLVNDFGNLLKFDNKEMDYTDLAVPDEFKIVVKYSATLTADAKIGNYAQLDNSNYYNENTTYLEYGDGQETGKASTKTYTWPFSVYKYTMNGQDEEALEGVAFSLKYNTTDLYFIKTGDDDDGTSVYQKCSQTDANATTKLVTGSSGKFKVEGLNGGGVYYLTETKPLDGYNAIPQQKFYIQDVTKGTDTTGQFSTNAGNEYKVLNNKGVILPSTGGMGTTIFYVAGILLVLGAVVVFIIKKRTSAKRG